MNKAIAIIMGLIVGLALGFAIFTVNHNVYDGKVTLSEQEYTEFQQEMAREDVTIAKMEELGSGYPRVVTFSVKGEDFKYGELRTPIEIAIGMALVFGVGGFVGGYSLLSMMNWGTESKGE